MTGESTWTTRWATCQRHITREFWLKTGGKILWAKMATKKIRGGGVTLNEDFIFWPKITTTYIQTYTINVCRTKINSQ